MAIACGAGLGPIGGICGVLAPGGGGGVWRNSLGGIEKDDNEDASEMKEFGSDKGRAGRGGLYGGEGNSL